MVRLAVKQAGLSSYCARLVTREGRPCGRAAPACARAAEAQARAAEAQARADRGPAMRRSAALKRKPLHSGGSGASQAAGAKRVALASADANARGGTGYTPAAPAKVRPAAPSAMRRTHTQPNTPVPGISALRCAQGGYEELPSQTQHGNTQTQGEDAASSPPRSLSLSDSGEAAAASPPASVSLLAEDGPTPRSEDEAEAEAEVEIVGGDFERVVSTGGFDLHSADQHVLSTNVVAVSRRLQKAFRNRPEAVTEFVGSLHAYLSEPANLRKSLKPWKSAQGGQRYFFASQDTLIKLLLGVEVLQPRLIDVLLELLATFSSDMQDEPELGGGGSSSAAENVPRLILNQIRWVDHLVEPMRLVNSLLSMLDMCSETFARDVIECL